MQKFIRYTIFKTKWGYFGLAGNGCSLLRTNLPLTKFEDVKSHLLTNFHKAQFDKSIFMPIQQQIIAYFEGQAVDFDFDIPIMLDSFSPFTRRVLLACRDIGFGRTVSYSELAKMIRNPGAARAVGGALAKNPLPLIIPCHRVIRNNGNIGGFSAQGGVKLKERMLELEHHCYRR